MARKTIYVSDLSGQEIEDGRGAEIRIKFHDARKGEASLDVTEAEADELAAHGLKRKRRGRRPAGPSLND